MDYWRRFWVGRGGMSTSPEQVIDLLRELNEYGEREQVEAKTTSEMGKSLLETVCAFANEPNLDGGHILLGVARGPAIDTFGERQYEVIGVPDPEKVVDDLATQCASAFNRPLRPRLEQVRIEGKIVIYGRVFEAAAGDKPIYFKNQGLPQGAFRRIGATDQRCTEDDLLVLYDARRRTPYDADVVQDARWDDLDPDTIEQYRRLRRNIAPEAEELLFDDRDLLLALNCIRETNGELRPTLAGILLFGTALALRRFFGMMRVDYIRVPGKEWIPDPENRYISVPIRAPLIRTIHRAEAAVLDDLPKAFYLPEGSLQRRDVPPLPSRVLREAIVNAVMHRDYRVYGPVQIIRYSNRIEISNPDYSLKDPERLGSAGSQTRNPTIAAILHDLNLAETKGTGIQVMRRLMKEEELVPPSFESSRRDNQFTARFVLHHFLSAEDLAWINSLGDLNLNGDEKLLLVFTKEVGAVDNSTYRDLTGTETLKASSSLRRLCSLGLLEKKGQSTATYYVPTTFLHDSIEQFLKPPPPAISSLRDLSNPHQKSNKSSMVPDKSSMVPDESSMAIEDGSDTRRQALLAMLPDEYRWSVEGMGNQIDDSAMRDVLRRLCNYRSWSAEELALLVRRNADYLKTRYLKPMINDGKLCYTIPDMPKHPSQAYRTPEETP